MMDSALHQPIVVPALAQQARETERDVLGTSLGRFVLLGDSRLEPMNAWSFMTSRAAPFEGAKPGPLQDSVVYGLRKRTERFGGVILLGRAESNDVTIHHTSISKLHARLHGFDDDGFIVEDASSRNGIFVNQARVDGPTRVSCGDVLCFGRRPFRVRRTDRLLTAIAPLFVR